MIEGQISAERLFYGNRHYSIARDRAPVRPVVYYVSWADRIKIGYSSRLNERLRGLYFDEVLAVEPGSLELERQRHLEYREYRVEKQREWFHNAPALLFHINTIRDRFPELIRSYA